MTTLKNILVATDFGEAAETAIAYSRELARRFGATLHVMHVVDDVGARMVTSTVGLPYDVTGIQVVVDRAEREKLEAIVTEEDRRELGAKTVLVTSLAPAREICDYAEKEHVDLIVLGTHGRGAIGHLFLGSVAERVVLTAHCPVLTVRHPEREFIRPDALQTLPRVSG